MEERRLLASSSRPVALSGDLQDTCEVSETDHEVKKQGQMLFNTEQKGALADLINRHSSWSRLRRDHSMGIVSKDYPVGLCEDGVKAAGSRGNTLSLKELQAAETMISDGVLHVGGRLRNAPLEYDTIHHVILPGNHHVTTLMVVRVIRL